MANWTRKSIVQDLERRIRNKQKGYAPGDQLPSEDDLRIIYGTSRSTVQDALGDLERDGIISRRMGIGSWVVRIPREARIVGFTKRLTDIGIKPSAEVRQKAKIMANDVTVHVQQAFRLDAETASKTCLYIIERLRYGDGKPLSWQTVYLRAADFQSNFLEEENFEGSLYAIYEEHYFRRVSWANERILARRANDEEMSLLKLDDSFPVVYARERTSFDQHNQVIEVLYCVDRGDSFEYFYRVLEDAPREPDAE